MKVVFKRELCSYFYSPIGYVCIAAITALYGFFYYQVMMTGSSSYVTAVYSMLFSFDMMIIPILTMRSMAEEKRNHTDQALLTAPVDVIRIVSGKFGACFGIYLIASVMGLLPAAAMSGFSQIPWKLVFGNFVGTLCYGGAMISVGIFLSALTVNQVVAAISTFAVSMLLIYMDAIAAAVSSDWIAAVIRGLSFYSRYSELTRGVFSVSGILYFIGIIFFFLYLTTVKIESERSGQWQWRSLYMGKALLLLMLIIVCNLICSGLVRRFPTLNIDMTEEKLYSLSDEAKEALKEIDEDIQVYIMAENRRRGAISFMQNMGFSTARSSCCWKRYSSTTDIFTSPSKIRARIRLS